MPNPTLASDEAPLYTAIADDLARSIATRTLRAGTRVPSVRALSRERGVSVTTALAALRALERRGLVEARPQSGYFVARRERAALPPTTPGPLTRPRVVGVNEVLAELVASKRDPSIVQFGSALPDPAWLPGPALRRIVAGCARRQPQLLSVYGDSSGTPGLRRAISARYAEVGCPIDPEELIVTNGCMEALNLAIATVARAGDVIAIESPAYFGFLQIFEARGIRALEIPSDPATGMRVEALEQALAGPQGSRIRACLVVPSFSNPLGCAMPDAARAALVALCARHDLPLIEDDVYGELGFDGRRPRPLKSWDREGRTMLCSSYSKSLSPGLRVGWIAGGRWTEGLRLQRFVASVAVPGLVQQAITEYLGDRSYARHLRRLQTACRDGVERVSDAVERAFPSGTRLSRPQGGFVLWVELPGSADALALFRRAQPHGVVFAPGPLFTASTRFRNCLRLNCAGEWTPRTARAIAMLGRLAAEG